MDSPLINNHIGSRCTVFSRDNTFLFLGRLAKYNSSERILTIDDLGRDRALWNDLFPNMLVKIQLKSNASQEEIILMDCVVAETMEHSIAVNVQSVVAKREDRIFFRQNVMRSASISEVNGIPVHHRCKILNISATGIAIQSKNPYEIGDRLTMWRQRFCDSGPMHNVTFEVARTSPLPKGETLFGCRFIDLVVDEEDKLFRDIFALQAEELHTKRNT